MRILTVSKNLVVMSLQQLAGQQSQRKLTFGMAYPDSGKPGKSLGLAAPGPNAKD